jgi:hypothetical protein
MAIMTIQSEAQGENFPFLLIEVADPESELFLVNAPLHQFERTFRIGIGNKIDQAIIAFVGLDRGIQA